LENQETPETTEFYCVLAQKQGVLKQLQGKNRGKKGILAQKQRVPKQLQNDNKSNADFFVEKNWKSKREKDRQMRLDVINLLNTRTYSNRFLTKHFSAYMGVPAVPRYFLLSFNFSF